MHYIYIDLLNNEYYVYKTMRKISANHGVNWHTLRYQFKKKSRSEYSKGNFKIVKSKN